MSSLLWKGRILETQLGSEDFARLIASLATLSGVLLILIGYGCHALFGWERPFNECGAGFSGVLFALKVVLQDQNGGTVRVLGLPLPVPSQWGQVSNNSSRHVLLSCLRAILPTCWPATACMVSYSVYPLRKRSC